VSHRAAAACLPEPRPGELSLLPAVPAKSGAEEVGRASALAEELRLSAVTQNHWLHIRF